MKKDKNSLKQKIVIAIACLVIVACTISMTTMAWFTDTMQGTTNLTFGKIKLDDVKTTYSYNTNTNPAVASRAINGEDWTIVLDETSNDAFIRLLVNYGAPTALTNTTDDYYLANKAYYNASGVKLVAGTGYTVGAAIADKTAVKEYTYSLEYLTTAVETTNYKTLDLIKDMAYTTEYYAVTSGGVLGTTFLKGVKYYTCTNGEMTALVEGLDADYANGDTYTGFGSTVYVAYNYSTSATTKTLKIVEGELVTTNDSPTIGIVDNSVVGTATASVTEDRYVIYNAYIDWLITNIAIPETPEAVSTYFTEVSAGVGVDATKENYAFIRTAGTPAGSAEYFLASDLVGTALKAVRTDEDGITNNYVFASDGSIKIKDSADQLTLKSATLSASKTYSEITALTAAQKEKVLALKDGVYTKYTAGDSEITGATYYQYTGDVTVINGHAYFLKNATNGTPRELKYAQKGLGLGLSVDIQAIQTILSRKITAAVTIAGVSYAINDKATIGVISSTDNALNAGKLGAFKNGTYQHVATIEDIAPFFSVFD
jgi:predicted ribosomally synthesized peptide with SipW-like signal peptide